MAIIRATRAVGGDHLSNRGFTGGDWALLAGVALTWGVSFLFIKVGVETLRPPLVAVLRVAFGAVTLAVFPAARRPVPGRPGRR
jgi:drug/metabolite transporter (DMT)-like permease